MVTDHTDHTQRERKKRCRSKKCGEEMDVSSQRGSFMLMTMDKALKITGCEAQVVGRPVSGHFVGRASPVFLLFFSSLAVSLFLLAVMTRTCLYLRSRVALLKEKYNTEYSTVFGFPRDQRQRQIMVMGFIRWDMNPLPTPTSDPPSLQRRGEA